MEVRKTVSCGYAEKLFNKVKQLGNTFMIHTLLIAAWPCRKEHRLGNLTVGEPSQEHHLNQVSTGRDASRGTTGQHVPLDVLGGKELNIASVEFLSRVHHLNLASRK